MRHATRKARGGASGVSPRCSARSFRPRPPTNAKPARTAVGRRIAGTAKTGHPTTSSPEGDATGHARAVPARAHRDGRPRALFALLTVVAHSNAGGDPNRRACRLSGLMAGRKTGVFTAVLAHRAPAARRDSCRNAAQCRTLRVVSLLGSRTGRRCPWPRGVIATIEHGAPPQRHRAPRPAPVSPRSARPQASAQCSRRAGAVPDRSAPRCRTAPRPHPRIAPRGGSSNSPMWMISRCVTVLVTSREATRVR